MESAAPDEQDRLPKLEDLIDVDAIQTLTDSLVDLTGVVSAVLDLKGKVLVASGWQPICTQFHRQNPCTAKRCLESDTALASQLDAGKNYTIYKCKNGLVDVAVPLVIDARHVGNIFTGQFLLEPPDMEFFAKQADEFGFDKEAYLKALDKVPVLTRERVDRSLRLLQDLTALVANMGADRKRLWEANRDLEAKVAQRTAELQQEMDVRTKAEEFSESLIRSLPGVMYLFDQRGHMLRWNENFLSVTGCTAEQVRVMTPLDFIAFKDRDRVKAAIEDVFGQGQSKVEADLLTMRGQAIPYLLTGYRFTRDNMSYLIGIGLDITERAETEREKENLIQRLQETLAKVKQLSGFLPICSNCKKIRDDAGYWKQIEEYLSDHSEAEFSHSLCPECLKALYPDLDIRAK